MLKLIGIIVAVMPIIVFVRAIFMGSKRRSQAMSDFMKQVDYAVWAILFMIGVGLVFSVGRLIYDFGSATPRTVQELSTRFPEGLAYSIPYDTTRFVEVSIREVLQTLGIAEVGRDDAFRAASPDGGRRRDSD